MEGGESDSLVAIDMLATFVAGAASVKEPAEQSNELLGRLTRALSSRVKAERAAIERCRYGRKKGEVN